MVSIQDVYNSFVGSFPLNVRMMREYCNVQTVEFAPKPDSLLHIGSVPAATFMLPMDTMIAPHLLITQTWEVETIKRVRALVEGRHAAVTLVDIGANVGLFTREVLGMTPAFQKAFAYEPSPMNFRCLVHNVAPFDRVQAQNCALGATAGLMTFHLDPDNTGNNSLNIAAIPSGTNSTSIQVPVKASHDEAQTWVAAGLPIFYKSDTQSYDEIIAASIGLEVWDHVFAGMFELWCIDRPQFPAGKLSAILDKYPYKCFLDEPDRQIETSEIISYCSKADGSMKELLFWT